MVDTDTLLTALYVMADDFLQTPNPARLHSRPQGFPDQE